MSEATTVYLQNSGVLQRLLDGVTTSVLEIGLGTGLNFLITAEQAMNSDTRLEYTAIDVRLPDARQIRELGFEAFIENRQLIEAWYQYLESREFEGTVVLVPGVCLTAHLAKAETLLANEQAFPHAAFDSVYHDAFSPNASEELWTREFFEQLRRVLRPSGTLTTYCVKSVVRRRLSEAGFQVQCLPGPEGGKRQVLLATT